MTLREYRAFKGFQRKFVVGKIGISGKHLNDIEAGRVNLTDKVATKLSEVYNTGADEILQMYVEGRNENSRNIEATRKSS